MKETVTLVFPDGYKHKWKIKKGIRGSRDALKIKKLIETRGDPTEIIGEGSVAKLLKKEYAIYLQNKEEYGGVSTKDILKVGAELTGIPVKKIQRLSNKMKRKFEKWRSNK